MHLNMKATKAYDVRHILLLSSLCLSKMLVSKLQREGRGGTNLRTVKSWSRQLGPPSLKHWRKILLQSGDGSSSV